MRSPNASLSALVPDTGCRSSARQRAGLPSRICNLPPLLLVCCLLFTVTQGGKAYYVDCSVSQAGSGLAQDSPWNSLAPVNQHTFSAGDEILFKRGTACDGQLWPKGSGRKGTPITLAAYGVGRLPRIEGGRQHAALYLFNQQNWHIREFEIVGGSPYGVLITGDEGVLRNIHLSNLTVHGGSGTPPDKRTALLAVIAGDPDQTFEDVRIEGVTAYDTTQWAGILVDGGAPGLPRGAEGKNPPTLRARNVTVRNCLVHDVGGDGIILFRVEDGLIEKSVAWNIGMMHRYTNDGPQNPNAIWTWNCHRCVVQFTEGFLADTAGVDGGVYDIDWGSVDSTIQYNFGHDSSGYCLSVFGAGGTVTSNSTVRYNLCLNNGRSPRLARRQGDIYLSTWGGGHLDGVKIYNNTIFWNPPTDAPAVKNEAEFRGDRENAFFNNLIVSTVPTLVDSAGGGLDFDHNLYWHTGPGLPVWRMGSQTVSSIRSLSGQEGAGRYLKPELSGTQGRPPFLLFGPRSGADSMVAAAAFGEEPANDVLGRPVPFHRRSIGAIEAHEEELIDTTVIPSHLTLETVAGEKRQFPPGGWTLLTFLDFDQKEDLLRDQQSQTVFLRSLQEQFGRAGLKIYLVVPPDGSDRLVNTIHDWKLDGLSVLVDKEGELGRLLPADRQPATALFGPDLRLTRLWKSLVLPAELGLLLRSVLGPPPGFAEVKIH